MAEIDVIRDMAKQVLVTKTLSGENDNYLWDRAQRLVRNVEHICRLPEITEQNLSVDRFCLTAAAYFCEAGFARFADAQDVSARLVLADVSAQDLRDFSAQIVTEKLAGALGGPKIDKINKIINETGNRWTNMTEAIILSDARSLDDMGAVGIFNEFRRYVVHGKGASDVLQSWKRKIDYRYWDARLKESFRFDSVRNIAQSRFETACGFMDQLTAEHNTRDIEEIILEAL